MRFYKGDSFSFSFMRLTQDDEIITTVPDKMRFTVKEDYNSKNVSIVKTLESGIKYDENNYIYTVDIEPGDTANLPFGAYIYDIELNDKGYVKTIDKGVLVLMKEVSN